MLGHFLIRIKLKLMALFPLHGTARYGSVRLTFGGFSTGYSTWYFFFYHQYHLGRGSKRAVPLPKRDM